MSLGKLIEPHYVLFCECVDPFHLASNLRSLTMWDREEIMQRGKSCGKLYAIQTLCESINAKVEWDELYKALLRLNLTKLAEVLNTEYCLQNPAAKQRPRNLEPRITSRSDDQSEQVIMEGSPANCKTSAAESKLFALENGLSHTNLNINNSNVYLVMGNNNTVENYPQPNPHSSVDDEGSEDFADVNFEVIREEVDINSTAINGLLDGMLNEQSGPMRINAQISCNSADGHSTKHPFYTENSFHHTGESGNSFDDRNEMTTHHHRISSTDFPPAVSMNMLSPKESIDPCHQGTRSLPSSSQSNPSLFSNGKRVSGSPDWSGKGDYLKDFGIEMRKQRKDEKEEDNEETKVKSVAVRE